MLFMAYDLSGVRIPVYNAALDVRFDILRTRDVPAYLRFRVNAASREVERRILRGDRCFVSWHGDDIIDACWTATGSVYVPYIKRSLLIPDREVYSYDSYTHPAFRGRGIYMARNSYTARLHQEEGFQRSIALVAFENYSAWLILTRSGLRTLGAYHYLRTPLKGFYWETAEPGGALPPLLAARDPERSSRAIARAASGI